MVARIFSVVAGAGGCSGGSRYWRRGAPGRCITVVVAVRTVGAGVRLVWAARRHRGKVVVVSMRSNNTLERTVNHRGRIVLAMDCVLADAQCRSCSAAQLGR